MLQRHLLHCWRKQRSKRRRQCAPAIAHEMNFLMARGGEHLYHTQHIMHSLAEQRTVEHEAVGCVEVVAAVTSEELIHTTGIRLRFADAAHITGEERRVRRGGEKFLHERFVA